MKQYKVTIIDMQPIDPPIGGGRLRLLGLYHDLGNNWDATYVGTFDWPGPGPRRLRLSSSLKEIDVPLSDQHFSVLGRWNSYVGERNIVDVCFSFMGSLSKEYLEQVYSSIQDADIIIFSHPWVYPLVQNKLTGNQIIVYDAHNFESALQAELWDDGGTGTEVLKNVIALESSLAKRADILLTCSSEDSNHFAKFFVTESKHILEVPNGVFSSKIRPPNKKQKQSSKQKFKLDNPTAIFIGSAFAPNIEAVEYISIHLAPQLPSITFLICGGVAESPLLNRFRSTANKNLRLIGPVTEEEKQHYLWAADVGLNPMFSGSGTNIKMFDFMASGLPVVATDVGARGIIGNESDGLFVCSHNKIATSLAQVINDGLLLQTGNAARKLVENRYSWEKISKNLGSQLEAFIKVRSRNKSSASLKPDSRYSKPPSSTVRHINAFENPHIARKRIGLISSWNTRCGIAEYSQTLANVLSSRGWQCCVMHPQNGHIAADSIDDKDISISIEDVWAYKRLGGKNVQTACSRFGINTLLVQHHPGFFDEETLVSIVNNCSSKGIQVLVTCHNSDSIALKTLYECDKAGVQIIIHNQADVNQLQKNGIINVNYVPLGVSGIIGIDKGLFQLPDGSTKSGPTVGTFGFLRPHKGVLKLIEAFSIIRDIYPNSSLQIMTAKHASEESSRYLNECLSKLSANNLDRDDRVVFDYHFHDMNYTLKQLLNCNILLFPYEESNEGASAALNSAISLARPIVATKVQIFKDAMNAIYCIENNEPITIALAICNIYSNPDLYLQLSNASQGYATKNNISVTADKYESLFLAFHKPI